MLSGLQVQVASTQILFTFRILGPMKLVRLIFPTDSVTIYSLIADSNALRLPLVSSCTARKILIHLDDSSEARNPPADTNVECFLVCELNSCHCNNLCHWAAVPCKSLLIYGKHT